MSKTLWNTIKIEVPEKMVNITKNDKVVVKHSLTKTNNISKSNKEPSIKIISGDINKPKIINDGKEWNVEELKISMKKAKDLGKKNEGKEYEKKSEKENLKNYIKRIDRKINIKHERKERKQKQVNERREISNKIFRERQAQYAKEIEIIESEIEEMKAKKKNINLRY